MIHNLFDGCIQERFDENTNRFTTITYAPLHPLLLSANRSTTARSQADPPGSPSMTVSDELLLLSYHLHALSFDFLYHDINYRNLVSPSVYAKQIHMLTARGFLSGHEYKGKNISLFPYQTAYRITNAGVSYLQQKGLLSDYDQDENTEQMKSNTARSRRKSFTLPHDHANAKASASILLAMRECGAGDCSYEMEHVITKDQIGFVTIADAYLTGRFSDCLHPDGTYGDTKFGIYLETDMGTEKTFVLLSKLFRYMDYAPFTTVQQANAKARTDSALLFSCMCYGNPDAMLSTFRSDLDALILLAREIGPCSDTELLSYLERDPLLKKDPVKKRSVLRLATILMHALPASLASLLFQLDKQADRKTYDNFKRILRRQIIYRHSAELAEKRMHTLTNYILSAYDRTPYALSHGYKRGAAVNIYRGLCRGMSVLFCDPYSAGDRAASLFPPAKADDSFSGILSAAFQGTASYVITAVHHPSVPEDSRRISLLDGSGVMIFRPARVITFQDSMTGKSCSLGIEDAWDLGGMIRVNCYAEKGRPSDFAGMRYLVLVDSYLQAYSYCETLDLWPDLDEGDPFDLGSSNRSVLFLLRDQPSALFLVHPGKDSAMRFQFYQESSNG